MRSRLPVLRQRRRYIVFDLEAEDLVHERDLYTEISSAYSSLFGDVSENRLRLISFDGKVGILRCINGHVEATRAALATVHTIAGIRCGIRVIGVGGTILAATEKYIPQMSYVAAEIGKRIDLGEISGWIKRQRCSEIDIEPDVRREGSDTRYLGLTYFDLDGGCVDADGTSDGL